VLCVTVQSQAGLGLVPRASLLHLFGFICTDYSRGGCFFTSTRYIGWFSITSG